MRSVLNENGDFFSSIFNAYKELKKNGEKNHYLGGSIAKYVNKNLVMTFPMICDNTLSVDTMQTISKANEKNIVTMFQQFFASNSINGSDGAAILRIVHKNMDSDIEDIIDAIDKYVSENTEIDPVKDAVVRDAIREMVYQLKTPQKVFPTESLNETSLNDYVVRNMNGNSVVMEVKRDFGDEVRYQLQKGTNDVDKNPNYGSEKNERERRKDERDEAEETRKEEKRGEEREKRAEEREKRAEERNKDEGIDRRHGNQDLKDRDMQNQFFTRQILDSDFKKANELQPSALIVNFNTVEDGRVIDRKSFIAGVKSRMIGVDSIDIVERLVAKKKSELSFKNFIKATTGEISFVGDFLFAVKQQKLNAKNAAKKGYAAQMWNHLEKRALGNKASQFSRKSNDASAITTLIVNQETANYMLAAYKFNLEDPKTAIKVMDDFNLMGIFIADEANEAVKYIAAGNDYYEIVAYSALSREAKEAKAYKDTVNLINKAGR